MQFQYGFRRRILDLYHRWFHRRIVRQLNNYSNNSFSNDKFIGRVSAMLKIQSNICIGDTPSDSIINEAKKAFDGIFNLLGSGEVQLKPISWHTDFKTGFKWPPGTFYRNYRQEGIDSDSDVKVPRELSRCHHLLKLGLAYRFTSDEKYREACLSHIISWINDNPLMYSINWGCTMDVAIRAVNWIWALGLISDSNYLDSKTLEKIKGSLYQHGWFIYRNPEKEQLNNHNHYLADLAGQIHLGLLFGDMEEPNRWLKKGKEELFREIRIQILPSGMSYERSTNYNRLVLELILIPIILLKRNGHEIPSDIWYRLEKNFEFIMYSLKPDGTSPIIGDQDNGRLLPFGVEDINDFCYLLSLGALLFGKPDLKRYGDGFNVYCSVLGSDGALEKWNKIPDKEIELGSTDFPDTGLYIMRKNNDYLLFNATGMGLYPEIGYGGHTHSDLLSFELFTLGKTFLLDPGSYVYTADAGQRMLFRSTAMHNTLTIDGLSQNNIRKEILWGFDRDAIPKVIKWETNKDFDIIIATHNGYTRLQEPAIHERTIIFNKADEKWIIKDTITGEGQHICEWFFHFDTGIDFDIKENSVETKCEDDKNIILIFDKKPGLILKKEKSFVSKSYGTKEDGYILVALIKGTVPVGLNIEIMKLN